MSIAFVLGNGTSRSSINLTDLKIRGKVYGCNALYREFTPDYLVAVDTKMVLEIAETNIQTQLEVWTNFNHSYKNINGLNYFKPSKGWSSGPTALWKASEDNYSEIYILGFDYKGIENLVNNIYAGTRNYKSKKDSATYYGNWLKQTITTIRTHQQIRYIRVTDTDGFIPKEFVDMKNLEHITVENFKDFLKSTL